MPHPTTPSRETTLNIRVDARLKAEFALAAEAENRTGSEVLESLMREYVEEARRRRFIREARSASQLISVSEDEAEVIIWGSV